MSMSSLVVHQRLFQMISPGLEGLHTCQIYSNRTTRGISVTFSLPMQLPPPPYQLPAKYFSVFLSIQAKSSISKPSFIIFERSEALVSRPYERN